MVVFLGQFHRGNKGVEESSFVENVTGCKTQDIDPAFGRGEPWLCFWEREKVLGDVDVGRVKICFRELWRFIKGK